MKYHASSWILAVGLASASRVPRGPHGTIFRREVPQEHSHNFVLALVRTSLQGNNPKGIQDPVFGLLGNAAAAAGAGTVTNLDCLQQETADQAFTNAKAAGDIPGMAGALLFRAIERNTAGVGKTSVLCSEKAVNPEIAALTQHQDPASANAASVNKGITLELARQLAAVGADPLLALDSGTFASGNTNDATGKGNSCDTLDDEPGCIFSERRLVLDATEEEISSAVAGITPTVTGTGVLSATQVDFAGLNVANGVATSGAANQNIAVTTTAAVNTASSALACEPVTVTVTSAGTTDSAATTSCSVIITTIAGGASTLATITSASAVATSTGTAATGTNLQTFTGTLGGAAPPVTSDTSNRPFSVKGNTFLNLGAALQRSCDVQHNACANAANSGVLEGGTEQCEQQVRDCTAAKDSAVAAAAAVQKTRRQASGAESFGTCGSPVILFSSNLKDRQGAAFIAEDQTDYSHGSALGIGVIAGFICQRLSSPCKAPADIQASCTSASAAAVATTQNQAAADVFNSVMGVADAASGAGGGNVAATMSAASVVMTITQCA